MLFVPGTCSASQRAVQRPSLATKFSFTGFLDLNRHAGVASGPFCSGSLGWPQARTPGAAATGRLLAMSVVSSTATPLLYPEPLIEDQAGLEQHQQPAPWIPPVGRPGLYDSEGRLVLKALTLPELEAWCAAEGEEAPANRALQIWRWMYADPPAGFWIHSLEETLGRQNGFSARFIEKVSSRVSLDGGLVLQQVVRAADGTRKLVFQLTQGEAAGGSVETVLIPIIRQQGLRDRLTICVSSQVGCAMNCQFCYTGRMGLLGNLTTAQIVEQVVETRRFLAREGDSTQLTNLVFMGMGEPLANTEAVLAASDIVSHYLGLHISHNKITISTVGLVPEMRSVLARSRVQIALSLHATTDEVRDWIVPVNRRYDLATLVAALEELFPKQQQTQQQLRSPDPGLAVIEDSTTAAAGAAGVTTCNANHHHQQPHANLAAGLGQVSTAGATPMVAEALSQGCLPAGAHEYSQSCSPSTSSTGQQQGPGQTQEQAGTSCMDEAVGRWLPPVAQENAILQSQPTGLGDSSGNSSSGDRGAGGGEAAGTSSTEQEMLSSSSSGAAGSSSGSASSTGRSLLVEYTMLHGINDTLEDAHRLAHMLARVNCKVNLIVFNPHAGTRFQPSLPEDVTAFRSALVQRGLVCTIRDSRGDDEMAACGQLGNVGLAFRPSPILEAPERFRRFLLPASPIPAA